MTDKWASRLSPISGDDMDIWVNDQSQLHRIDGPAITHHSSGVQHWYVNNQKVNSWEDLQRMANITNEELLLIVLKWGQIQQSRTHQDC